MPPVLLEPVPKDQASVLRNLLQLYAHDFSEHVPLDVLPDGRFDVPFDDRWWADSAHFPFFIRADGKVAGFALVRRGSRITSDEDVTDIAEFFVLRGMRRKGVGTSAAHAVFASFPGRIEIRVRRTNVAAKQFWFRAVKAWTGGDAASDAFSAGGVEWDVIRFAGAL